MGQIDPYEFDSSVTCTPESIRVPTSGLHWLVIPLTFPTACGDHDHWSVVGTLVARLFLWLGAGSEASK